MEIKRKKVLFLERGGILGHTRRGERVVPRGFKRI